MELAAKDLDLAAELLDRGGRRLDSAGWMGMNPKVTVTRKLNEDLLRMGYGTFARGDIETIDALMT